MNRPWLSTVNYTLSQLYIIHLPAFLNQVEYLFWQHIFLRFSKEKHTDLEQICVFENHIFSFSISAAAQSATSMALGLGGHPGTAISTGTTLLTLPTRA